MELVWIIRGVGAAMLMSRCLCLINYVIRYKKGVGMFHKPKLMVKDIMGFLESDKGRHREVVDGLHKKREKRQLDVDLTRFRYYPGQMVAVDNSDFNRQYQQIQQRQQDQLAQAYLGNLAAQGQKSLLGALGGFA